MKIFTKLPKVFPLEAIRNILPSPGCTKTMQSCAVQSTLRTGCLCLYTFLYSVQTTHILTDDDLVEMSLHFIFNTFTTLYMDISYSYNCMQKFGHDGETAWFKTSLSERAQLFERINCAVTYLCTFQLIISTYLLN